MAHDVLTAINKLHYDKAAKEAVEMFRKQLAEWNGPENAASLLKEYCDLYREREIELVGLWTECAVLFRHENDNLS